MMSQDNVDCCLESRQQEVIETRVLKFQYKGRSDDSFFSFSACTFNSIKFSSKYFWATPVTFNLFMFVSFQNIF